jgi:hypothetical protein
MLCNRTCILGTERRRCTHITNKFQALDSPTISRPHQQINTALFQMGFPSPPHFDANTRMAGTRPNQAFRTTSTTGLIIEKSQCDLRFLFPKLFATASFGQYFTARKNYRS